MRSVIFERFGEAAEVLQVREANIPKPNRGEVRVRMLASPINPSDLLYVQGRYGKQPSLPASPGFEGVGVVEESGGGLIGRMRLGKRVAVINAKGGNWQEQVVVPARQVIPVPTGVSDEQAASFFVNPASALVMIKKVLRVKRGSWVLVTAAGSALGRMVIKLGQLPDYQFSTLAVVRRREQVDELLRAGAKAVVCTADESLLDRVVEVTGGAGVPYAIDAVGGETGASVVPCLGRHGKMLVYGTLADAPMPINPRDLMVGEKTISGFWLSEWIRDQHIVTMLKLFRRIGNLMTQGSITTDIGGTFDLSDVRSAAEQAAKSGRGGKVLIRISR